jgi:AraC-like DNA-binding protein/ligand-binding sensor protein
MDNHKQLIEALINSPLFRDYQRAFSETTGLPVALRAVESWQLPYHGRRQENRFCALVARQSSACANCLQVQQQLGERAQAGVQSMTCPFGLRETAIPVRVGEVVIGFLQTGQVFAQRPARRQFERVVRLARRWGMRENRAELHEAYYASRVLGDRQHEFVVKLLGIFAEHLSLISNQLVVSRQNEEPPVIRRAKDYIETHQGEELRLTAVARAVNTSPFYFCKMFKKATGLNFTDYLSRVRVEKAKNLLLNPNTRISEVAFAAGFQSLSHFNRVFRRIAGESPTSYRDKLPKS